jgi:hypothetical protein
MAGNTLMKAQHDRIQLAESRGLQPAQLEFMETVPHVFWVVNSPPLEAGMLGNVKIALRGPLKSAEKTTNQ